MQSYLSTSVITVDYVNQMIILQIHLPRLWKKIGFGIHRVGWDLSP